MVPVVGFDNSQKLAVPSQGAAKAPRMVELLLHSLSVDGSRC